MGLSFLYEVGERRIRLWRRSLFMFTKTSREQGPFHEAGYTDYYFYGEDFENLKLGRFE